MCTLVILHRPGHPWPMLLAANRDEMRDRPALPPGRHWARHPQLVAGLDLTGGGSWLGLNERGLIAAVTNRVGSLGPLPNKRSRGELVLEALGHGDAVGAAAALHGGDYRAYRPFNLVLADAQGAFWMRHAGSGKAELFPIEPGLHMLTARELDDSADARIRAFLPRFRAAQVPDPDVGDWSVWRELLGERRSPSGEPEGAMNLAFPNGFVTRAASLMALPGRTGDPTESLWLYADGAPDEAPFEPVRA